MLSSLKWRRFLEIWNVLQDQNPCEIEDWNQFPPGDANVQFFWTYSKRTKKSFIRHIRVLTGFTGCPKKMARLLPRNGHAKFDLLSTGQKDFGIIISNCGYWISMLIFHGTAALGFIRFSPWVCSADPVVVRQDRANWARYATRHSKKTAKNATLKSGQIWPFFQHPNLFFFQHVSNTFPTSFGYGFLQGYSQPKYSQIPPNTPKYCLLASKESKLCKRS